MQYLLLAFALALVGLDADAMTTTAGCLSNPAVEIQQAECRESY